MLDLISYASILVDSSGCLDDGAIWLMKYLCNASSPLACKSLRLIGHHLRKHRQVAILFSQLSHQQSSLQIHLFSENLHQGDVT